MGRARRRVGPAGNHSHLAFLPLVGTVSRERPHRLNSSTDCFLSHYYSSSSISPRTYRRPMWDHLHVTSYSRASRSVSAQEKWKWRWKWKWEWKWRKKGRGRGSCWRRGGTSSCSLLYTSTYRLHCLRQTTFPPFPPPRLASPSFLSLSARRHLFPYRRVAQRR